MWWSFALSAIGAFGFLAVGQLKWWWGWWINVANQALWLTYALVTQQWGFLISVALFGTVFFINARKAGLEHKARKRRMQTAKQLFLEKQNDGAGITVVSPVEFPPVTLRREDLMDVPDLRAVMYQEMFSAPQFDECTFFHPGPRCRSEVCEHRSRV